jgi:hypothetical protein
MRGRSNKTQVRFLGCASVFYVLSVCLACVEQQCAGQRTTAHHGAFHVGLAFVLMIVMLGFDSFRAFMCMCCALLFAVLMPLGVLLSRHDPPRSAYVGALVRHLRARHLTILVICRVSAICSNLLNCFLRAPYC